MSIDYANLTIEQMETMSDEDFAKLDPSQFNKATTPPVVESQEEAAVQVSAEPEIVEQPQEQQVETTPAQEPQTADEPASDEPANGIVSEAEQAQEAGAETQPGEEAKPNTQEQAQPNQPATTPEVSVEKAFYEKVTAGFKANGKTYKIDSADDLIALAQQGLNYSQKMATIKPSLKLVRALQERGIESLEQLGELFDLHDKKPEAIAALVQKSGIDTYQLEEQAKNYVPTVPVVNEQAFEFEQVASALEDNPHFPAVVQQLQTYDDQTKQEIFSKPHLLNVLTDHVANGYYDQIMARYEVEKATGRTRGLSFLQAYDAIGQQLFGQPQQAPAQQPVQQVVQTVPTQVVAKPVPVAQKQNTSNNAARQAAASNTSTATTVQKIIMTPEQLWSLSDEEFAKINPKYL